VHVNVKLCSIEMDLNFGIISIVTQCRTEIGMRQTYT